MTDEIILFDLPSKDGKAWSLNPWRVRIMLNFSGVPYKTEFVEYPDIRGKLEGHVPPTDDETPYTIPAIKFPDGTWVMDSWKIADEFQKRHLSIQLHLDSPYLTRLKAAFGPALQPLRPVLLPLVASRVLGEASKPYFYETREKSIGKSLDQWYAENEATAYEKAAPELKKISDLLTENKEGPFFDGKTAGFADFHWVGLLMFAKALGEDQLDKLLKASGNEKAHLDLLEATKEWWKRND